MKKLFAVAVMVAVALTSCVKNEVITPEKEITFKNFALSNKALVGSGDLSTSLTFGAYADASGSWYIQNGEVKYKTSYWGFDPAEYWPTDGAGAPIGLSFFAYLPYIDNTGTTQVACDEANGISISGADLGTTIGSQTDYLLAQETAVYSVQSTAVPVAFEHISSLLLFSAEDVTVVPELREKITVNSITIKQVSTTGSYANAGADDVAGNWTPGAATDLAPITLNKDVTVAGVELTTNTSNPVLVVPTALTTDKQQIVVNYSVAAYTYGGTDFAARPNLTKTINLNAGTITEWEQGKRYVYNLQFNLTEELEITFAPTVTDWTTVNDDIIIENL